MFAMTKKTEYALIAMAHLARHSGEIASARDIAERYQLRLPLLMNVLKTLQHRGLLKSARGATGGYWLATPPEQVSLARLVEAIEGPTRFVRCAPPEPESVERLVCELLPSCPIRMPVLKVHEYLEKFLHGVTLAQIAFDNDFAKTGAAPLKVLAQ
jgi:Rrf2 family protein